MSPETLRSYATIMEAPRKGEQRKNENVPVLPSEIALACARALRFYAAWLEADAQAGLKQELIKAFGGTGPLAM